VAFIKSFCALRSRQKCLILIAWIFIFCFAVQAQEKTISSSPCLTLTATHSGKNSFLWGEQITISAATQDKPDAKFNWTISSGKILNGQGTNTIAIDTNTTNGDLKVDLEVENNGAVCSHSLSLERIACILPPEIDRYGNLPLEAEFARLDNVGATFARESPEFQIFIIAQNGNKTDETKSLKRIVRAKKYLITTHKIDSTKISLYVSADKDLDYDQTIIYIMPKDQMFLANDYKLVTEDEFLELSKKLVRPKRKKN
jgi:hypothetical protein